MEKRKLNILVLAGGDSSEREVSINSSLAIAKALNEAGHKVRIIDSLNGKYLTESSAQLSDHSPEKSRGKDGRPGVLPVHEFEQARDAGLDVVFIGLHGGSGENGSIQAALDMLGMPYTGSPMSASAVAMNKDISKRVMLSLGIPTADWKSYDASLGATAATVQGDFDQGHPIPLPVVIKPVDSGSTVGLSLVEEADQIADAARVAFEESPLIMVEKYVQGREITIAVLDGEALPPVEIRPTHKLYDYTCKYTKGKSEYFCPAEIDAELVKKLSSDAVRFYHTIGCSGYGRVDFIVAPDNTYICLELNTLPGMTALSLFPMAARAAGIEFGDLLEKLCLLALKE